ncbi:hypothetical protein M407DRAFT_243640 [Tulasnella calospora MUT 4182]|uniref:Uncharacterized protein n=1 Tax=Tulasnella calospora MUT 4182 TaxID=1051891 RepID=A0A0C3QK15_9AGAM|nr:hypothetical protein M407DRAFT_243640 [Tulasnella calospora MUT 4182]
MRWCRIKIARLGRGLGRLSDKVEFPASYGKALSNPSTRPCLARLLSPEGTFRLPSEADRTTSSYLRQRNMKSTTPQHDFRLHFAVQGTKLRLLR